MKTTLPGCAEKRAEGKSLYTKTLSGIHTQESKVKEKDK